MDSNNSGSYFKVTDLDDFLAPAQDWVVQLMTSKKTDMPDTEIKQGSVQIEIENDWEDGGSMTGGVRPDLI